MSADNQEGSSDRGLTMTTPGEGGWNFSDRGGWLLAVWLLGGGACGDNLVPVVQLHLIPADPATVRARMFGTATDPVGRQTKVALDFLSGPFDFLAVTLPAGTPRPTVYKVDLYRDATCMIATGSATMTLATEEVVQLPVLMSPVYWCDETPRQSYRQIQIDMRSLTCLQPGCHSPTSSSKLRLDTTLGKELDNYQQLLSQGLLIKGDAASSWLSKTPSTGQAINGTSHVKSLTGSKLTEWTSWVNAGAPF